MVSATTEQNNEIYNLQSRGRRKSSFAGSINTFAERGGVNSEIQSSPSPDSRERRKSSFASSINTFAERGGVNSEDSLATSATKLPQLVTGTEKGSPPIPMSPKASATSPRALKIKADSLDVDEQTDSPSLQPKKNFFQNMVNAVCDESETKLDPMRALMCAGRSSFADGEDDPRTDAQKKVHKAAMRAEIRNKLLRKTMKAPSPHKSPSKNRSKPSLGVAADYIKEKKRSSLLSATKLDCEDFDDLSDDSEDVGMDAFLGSIKDVLCQ